MVDNIDGKYKTISKWKRFQIIFDNKKDKYNKTLHEHN